MAHPGLPPGLPRRRALYTHARGEGRAPAAPARVGDAALRAGEHAARARARTRRRLGARVDAAPLPRARGDADAPGADGRRRIPDVPGVSRAALVRARPDEGRRPLRRGPRPRRVRRARDVDDVEVRAPAPALRWREGRRSLQPAHALDERAEE